MAAHQIGLEESHTKILTKLSNIENYLDIGGDVPRYGVCVDLNESDPTRRVTYLGDARNKIPAHMNFASGKFDYGDWGDMWFIKDNKPLMLKSDGTVDYYLDPDDYTLKEDGVTASDVANSDYDGNAMAQFPTVWLKQYESAGKLYSWVCQTQYDETYQAYAHTKEDGTIADYFYWGTFGGSSVDSKMRSIKGLDRMHTQTATTERAYAQANGTGWDVHSWSQRNLIVSLLTLICCSDDTQTAFGYGILPGSSSAYHTKTGTISDKGQFYGSSADYTTQVKVFHVEAPWGDKWDRVTGLFYNSEGILAKMTPPYNLTGDGYDRTGIKISGTSGGYISKTTMSKYGRIPTQVSGSDSTYEGDACWFNASQLNMAHVGVSANSSGALGGAFGLAVTYPASDADWSDGAGLSFL